MTTVDLQLLRIDSPRDGELCPLVVSGPSGVGKGTLLTSIKQYLPNAFGVSISHTTREPRQDENNGEHYHFISKQEFYQKIKANFFLEHAQVHDGNFYGTSFDAVAAIKAKNLICLLEVDVQGAQKIKQSELKCRYLFVTTTFGLETLQKRMKSRGTETEKQIEKRLATAQTEINFQQNHPHFFDCVIFNDDIEESTRQLSEALFQWYPLLKAKFSFLNDDYKTSDIANTPLHNAVRVQNISKRQSMHLYEDCGSFSNIETGEMLCRNVLQNVVGYYTNTDVLTFGNEQIIQLILEFMDVCPRNRLSKFLQLNQTGNKFDHVFQQLFLMDHSVSTHMQLQLQMQLSKRWTIGNSCEFYPALNLQTMVSVFFAHVSEIMGGRLYQVVGVIRDHEFINNREQLSVKSISPSSWDPCWDVYFYLRCDADLKGSLIFSEVWSTMLIFGIDDDNIRAGTESGDWNMIGKSPMKFGFNLEDGSEYDDVD